MYYKAFQKPVFFFIVFGFLLTSFGLFSPQAQAATNLISNPSVEVGTPTDWSKVGWGTNNPVFTLENNGQDGTKSLKVTMNSYSNGDARWSFKDVAVSPNTKYTFSAYYKSNVQLEVDIDSTLTSNSHTYDWLGDIPASPTNWTLVTYTFTTASNAKSVNVFFPIDKVGWIQTDNYSLSTDSTTPPPNPNPTPTPTPTPVPSNAFKRPLISIDFDDGWRNAYTSGFPVMNEFGFKGSALIVTDTAKNPANYGNLYMTPTQIVDLKNQGHKIASHSVTHASLVSLNSTQLRNEVVNSKTYLEGLTGQPITYFATPFCDYNATVTNLVKQYYSSGMRNCGDTTNEKPSFDKYNINSFPVLKRTTLTEIKNAINTAKQNNQWLVLMYHEVKSSTDEYSVSQATLRSHLQAIKDSGVAVLPSQDALAEIATQ
jgi:peptidoglycan/xylan/chitin deacetylase (PgdA/CDA1 family)